MLSEESAINSTCKHENQRLMRDKAPFKALFTYFYLMLDNVVRSSMKKQKADIQYMNASFEDD